MHGVLSISKPAGPTSHDVVAKIRRIIKEKRVGHTGTLDPMATGVLVVCVGKATRLVEYLVPQHKEYVAEMVLGATTTTQDAEGEVTSETDASHITQEMVEAVLPKFTGNVMQIPPMVSAVKHQGKRLYELARKDIEVERQPREITVYELEMTGFSPSKIDLRIVCSSGTYIRTICADIGEALGVGGYMKSLIRTRVGRFQLQDAISLDKLEDIVADGRIEDHLISLNDAMSDYPCVVADEAQEILISTGREIASPMELPEGSVVRVVSSSGVFLAIGSIRKGDDGSLVKPEKVFVEGAG